MVFVNWYLSIVVRIVFLGGNGGIGGNGFFNFVELERDFKKLYYRNFIDYKRGMIICYYLKVY